MQDAPSLLAPIPDAAEPLCLTDPRAVWRRLRRGGHPVESSYLTALDALHALPSDYPGHSDIASWLLAEERAARQAEEEGQPPLPLGGRILESTDIARLPPRPQLVRSVLRQGEVALMVGATKSRKTWLAIDLALSVAGGRLWLGRECAPAPALFVDAECPREVLGERLRILERDRSPRAAERLSWVARRGSCPTSVLDACCDLRQDIAESDAHLCVIDTMSAYFPVKDENDNAEATSLLSRITDVAEEMQCAIVLVHHTPKASGGKRSVVDAGAGAGAYARRVDTVIAIREEEDEAKEVHMYLDVRSRSCEALPRMRLGWVGMRAHVEQVG